MTFWVVSEPPAIKTVPAAAAGGAAATSAAIDPRVAQVARMATPRLNRDLFTNGSFRPGTNAMPKG